MSRQCETLQTLQRFYYLRVSVTHTFRSYLAITTSQLMAQLCLKLYFLYRMQHGGDNISQTKKQFIFLFVKFLK